MKKIILLSIFAGLVSANFLQSNSNPNGKPFLVSLGIEKNIQSFKYYDKSTFYITVPISDMMTFKYRENVSYTDQMVVLQSEHDKIENLDKHYTLEFHLPLYKIWEK